MDTKDTLRSRRRQLGLTQQDIARAVGVSEATVSRWESGDIAEVGSGKIAALAAVLQLTPTQLVQGTPQSAMAPPNREDASTGSHGGTPPPAMAPPDELAPYLEQLRTRPEMRAFFSLAKNATRQEVEDAMHIVEAYLAGRQAGRQDPEDE